MPRRIPSFHLALIAIYSFWISLAHAVSGQEPLKGDTPAAEPRGYALGEPIPVSCLNRTIDTGEHITDASGHLQYIPFPTCLETAQPLSLAFGIEQQLNCTLDYISDPFFHLLEFYIHSDAPLSCRIPSRPLPPSVLERAFQDAEDGTQEGALGSQSNLYTPLVIALAGTLQLSHLHVGNELNLLVHAAPKAEAPGTIDAATAYSVSSHTRNARVTIGDSLALRFSVRWYPSTTLPPGWSGYGGHLYKSTFLYCLLSAGASAAICVAYFRGVELPRRLKRYATDRVGRGGGYGLPVANGRANGYGGYGYGVGTGKKD